MRLRLLTLILLVSGWAGGNAFADEAAGSVVRGLSLSLTLPKILWTTQETLTLEAVLVNVSEKPFVVDTFGKLDVLYLGKRRGTIVPSCWALILEPKADLTPIRQGRYTLEAASFIRLGPGESYAQRLSRPLAAMKPGQYRAILTYVPRHAGASFSLPDRWEEQQGIRDPLWIGMAYSNGVELEIVQE